MMKRHADMGRTNKPATIINNSPHHRGFAQNFSKLQFGVDAVLPADNIHSLAMKTFDGGSNQRQGIGLDGNKDDISEMDALVAYLQVLGTMVDFKKFEDGYFTRFR